MTEDALAETRRLARALLLDLAAGRADPSVIRPREGDYERIFRPEAVEQMRAHFERLWASNPVPAPGPGQTEVTLHVVLGGLLIVDNLFTRDFPGGYRRVAHHFMPAMEWVAWTFHAPGEERGMAYDGLVRIDDRFAWFPKPWRARGLAPLRTSG